GTQSWAVATTPVCVCTQVLPRGPNQAPCQLGICDPRFWNRGHFPTRPRPPVTRAASLRTTTGHLCLEIRQARFESDGGGLRCVYESASRLTGGPVRGPQGPRKPQSIKRMVWMRSGRRALLQAACIASFDWIAWSRGGLMVYATIVLDRFIALAACP